MVHDGSKPAGHRFADSAQNRPSGRGPALQHLLPRARRSAPLQGAPESHGGSRFRTEPAAPGPPRSSRLPERVARVPALRPRPADERPPQSTPPPALTSPPRPLPGVRRAEALAFGFSPSPQDGGHNEPAPRRLVLRRRVEERSARPTVGAEERCSSGSRKRTRRPARRPPARSPPARRPPRPGQPLSSPPAASRPRPGPGPAPPPAAAMKLTDSVLRSFRVAKVFRENSDKINCFDFSPNGETVISSSDDDSIVLYDCQEGK